MTETHPVYIGRDLKKEIDKESADMEITMRKLTERALRRGMSQELHRVPLPSELEEELDKAERKAETATSTGDLNRAQDRLDDVTARVEELDLPEDMAHIEDRTDEVRELIADVQAELDEDDE